MSETVSGKPDVLVKQNEYYVGVILACTSCTFIGTSFIIKKLSLNRLSSVGSVRAGAGGYGYIKDWMWWLGFLLMGIGEIVNFAAYMFAPASLVTPLGALSVLVSAVLASKVLGEHLNVLGKISCLLCIIGTTIFVIHAPKHEEVESLQELYELLCRPLFAYYVKFILVFITLTVFYIGPKYGQRYVYVYVSLCSAIGSMTVMACKSLGVAIKEAMQSDVSVGVKWVAAVLVFGLLLCITLQMNYLNRALDLFSTSIVTPVYYVMFTTMVIVASALLFEEWKYMGIKDIMGTISGFLIITTAIYMLNAYKDTNVAKDCTKSGQPPLWRSNRIYT